MPSSTVDHVLLQVTGFAAAAVLLVLWLWIADVRGWWPFNARDLVREFLELHDGATALLALTPALNRAALSVPAVPSAATGERLVPCKARRGAPACATSARVEAGDTVHVRSEHRSSSPRACGGSGARVHRVAMDMRPA